MTLTFYVIRSNVNDKSSDHHRRSIRHNVIDRLNVLSSSSSSSRFGLLFLSFSRTRLA